MLLQHRKSFALPYAAPLEEDEAQNKVFASKIMKRVSRMSQVAISTDSRLKDSEEKLQKQFLYFRKEFMDVANGSGTTVPLDMVEDTSGRLFSFVNQGVPLYILQILATETENIHLLRISLSLLIVTVALLRSKLPSESMQNINSDWNTVLIEMRANWAALALHQIADSGAVSVCINLIVNFVVQDIHELSLNLLAHLVTISEEAASQMLQVPTYKFDDGIDDERSLHVKKTQSSNANPTTTTPAKRGDLSRPSVTASTPADGSRPSSPASKAPKPGQQSAKKIKPTITHDDSSFSKSPLPVPYGMKELKNFSSKNLFVSNSVGPFSKKETKKEEESMGDISNSTKGRGHPHCLAYVLSVAALYPNRLLVLSSAAEIITAVASAKERSSEFAEIAAKTSTCLLPVLNSSDEGMTGKSSGQKGAHAHHQHHRLSQYGIIEWAGLKILLKFLLRLSKYKRDNDGFLDWRSVASSQHNQLELRYCHTSVLTTLMFLVAKSEIVANYMLTLTGAVDLIEFSAKQHLKNQVLQGALALFRIAIQEASRRKQNEIEAQRARDAAYAASLVLRADNRRMNPAHGSGKEFDLRQQRSASPGGRSRSKSPDPHLTINIGTSENGYNNSSAGGNLSVSTLGSQLDIVFAAAPSPRESGKAKPKTGLWKKLYLSTKSLQTIASASIANKSGKLSTGPLSQGGSNPPTTSRQSSKQFSPPASPSRHASDKLPTENSQPVGANEIGQARSISPSALISNSEINEKLPASGVAPDVRLVPVTSSTDIPIQSNVFPGSKFIDSDDYSRQRTVTSNGISSHAFSSLQSANKRPASAAQLPSLFKQVPGVSIRPMLPRRIEAEEVISGEFFGSKDVWLHQQQLQNEQQNEAFSGSDPYANNAAHYDHVAKEEYHYLGNKFGVHPSGKFVGGVGRIMRVYKKCGVPFNPHLQTQRPNTAPVSLRGHARGDGMYGLMSGRVGFAEKSVFEGCEDDPYEGADLANEMEPLYSAHVAGPQLEEMLEFPLMSSGIVPHETTSEYTEKLIAFAATQELPVMANEKTAAQKEEEGEFSRKQLRAQFVHEQELLKEAIKVSKAKQKTGSFDHQKVEKHKSKASRVPRSEPMDSIAHEFTLT